jgi:hypothetical protein
MKLLFVVVIIMLLSSCASDTEHENEPNEITYNAPVAQGKLIWDIPARFMPILSKERVEYFNDMLRERDFLYYVEFVAEPVNRQAFEMNIHSYLQLPKDIVFVERHKNFLYYSGYAMTPNEYQLEMLYLSDMPDANPHFHEPLNWNKLPSDHLYKNMVYSLFDNKYWASVTVNGGIYGLRGCYIPTTAYGFTFSPNIPQGFREREFLEGFLSDPYIVEANVSLLPQHNRMSFGIPQSQFIYENMLYFMVNILGYCMVTPYIAIDTERGAFNVFEEEAVRTFLRNMDYYNERKLFSVFANSLNINARRINDIPANYPIGFSPIVEPVYRQAHSLQIITANSDKKDDVLYLFYLLLTDRELADALIYGRYGIDYEFQNGSIVYLSDGATHPQFIDLRFDFALNFGFYSNLTPITPHYIQSNIMDYVDSLPISEYMGFRFIPYDYLMYDLILMMDRIVFDNVILEHSAFINHWLTFKMKDKDSVPGWEEGLDELILEMNEGGIEKIIEEINRQFANWKINHNSND